MCPGFVLRIVLLAQALAVFALGGCATGGETAITGAGEVAYDAEGRIEPNATVQRVIDGDTIKVDLAGRIESVRLLGIDTPETVARNRPVQCYGAEASTYLSSLLPEGTAITLIRDIELRDRYDRLLAYLVRAGDELFVNLDLLQKGYAGLMIYEPNTYHEQLFRGAEDRARSAAAGLWGKCGGPDVPLE